VPECKKRKKNKKPACGIFYFYCFCVFLGPYKGFGLPLLALCGLRIAFCFCFALSAWLWVALPEKTSTWISYQNVLVYWFFFTCVFMREKKH
jgi:hypothetical protein